MKISDFTENKEIKTLVTSLKTEGVDRKHFSDVVDASGKQYVELVMEGGGVLGVALIGYTWLLEQMGIRFLSLAGTSAGSINAMMLAGQGDISSAKSEKVIDELVNKNLYDFVDGNDDSKNFISAILAKTKRIKLVWRGWQILDEIFDDLGLNPGDDFTNWLSSYLEKNGVKSQADLDDKFGTLPPGLSIRPNILKTLEGLKPRLAIIAAELNTETKVEFPAMSALYWEKPAEANPALYVRASMSIPYFFVPLHLKRIPKGEEAVKRWEQLVKYRGQLPSEVYFVDGGIMSNFPINVFHKANTVPRLPTFGVRLGDDRDKPNKISSPLNLFGAMFNSLRHLYDYDFILKHPDYSRLIAKIDIGPHDWLNFALEDKAKIDLFKRGAEAAATFLRSFDWEGYKRIREEIKMPEEK